MYLTVQVCNGVLLGIQYKLTKNGSYLGFDVLEQIKRSDVSLSGPNGKGQYSWTLEERHDIVSGKRPVSGQWVPYGRSP